MSYILSCCLAFCAFGFGQFILKREKMCLSIFHCVSQYGIRVTNAEDLRRENKNACWRIGVRLLKKAKVGVRKKFWLAWKLTIYLSCDPSTMHSLSFSGHQSRPEFTLSSLLPLNSAPSTAYTVPRLKWRHRAKRPNIENLNGGTVNKNRANRVWRNIQFLIFYAFGVDFRRFHTALVIITTTRICFNNFWWKWKQTCKHLWQKYWNYYYLLLNNGILV